LIVELSQVTWNEAFHSASSQGLNIGIEDATYSEQKGYQLFLLVDFYTSADSANKLALSQDLISSAESGCAVTYFDNDGLEEEVTRYTCKRIH